MHALGTILSTGDILHSKTIFFFFLEWGDFWGGKKVKYEALASSYIDWEKNLLYKNGFYVS